MYFLFILPIDFPEPSHAAQRTVNVRINLCAYCLLTRFLCAIVTNISKFIVQYAHSNKSQYTKCTKIALYFWEKLCLTFLLKCVSRTFVQNVVAKCGPPTGETGPGPGELILSQLLLSHKSHSQIQKLVLPILVYVAFSQMMFSNSFCVNFILSTPFLYSYYIIKADCRQPLFDIF